MLPLDLCNLVFAYCSESSIVGWFVDALQHSNHSDAAWLFAVVKKNVPWNQLADEISHRTDTAMLDTLRVLGKDVMFRQPKYAQVFILNNAACVLRWLLEDQPGHARLLRSCINDLLKKDLLLQMDDDVEVACLLWEKKTLTRRMLQRKGSTVLMHACHRRQLKLMRFLVATCNVPVTWDVLSHVLQWEHNDDICRIVARAAKPDVWRDIDAYDFFNQSYLTYQEMMHIRKTIDPLETREALIRDCVYFGNFLFANYLSNNRFRPAIKHTQTKHNSKSDSVYSQAWICLFAIVIIVFWMAEFVQH